MATATAARTAPTGRSTVNQMQPFTWTGKDNGETRTLRTVTDVRP